MDLIAEAFDSLAFSCTLLLMVPLIAAALVGRRRAAGLALATVVATAAAAARFGGWFPATPTGDGQVVVGVVLGLAFGASLALVLARRRPLGDAGALGLVVVAGLISAWFWIPCVGPEFAAIIADLTPGPRPSPVLRLLIFNLTLASPALIILATIDMVDTAKSHAPRQDRAVSGWSLRMGPATAGGAAIAGMALAAMIVFDRYGELARLGT